MQTPLLAEERELVECSFAEALPPFEATYECTGRSRLEARLLQVDEAVEKTEVIARRPGLLVTGSAMSVCASWRTRYWRCWPRARR